MTLEETIGVDGHGASSPSPPVARRLLHVDSSTRVVVVDDHDMFRRGLARLLSEGGVQVVGEASRAAAAVRLVGELRPAVVLMDLDMPVMGGVEAMRAMHTECPGCAVLLLGTAPETEQSVEALLAGAAGCLSKGSSLEELLYAVGAVAGGGVVVPPDLGGELLRRLRAHEPDIAASAELDLSSRESDILRLMVGGFDNAEIAARLFISPNTVKNHVGRIIRKLGVSNRLQASVQAVRTGLVR